MGHDIKSTTVTTIKHMKWWGWGDTNKEFDISNKPGLWPYIEKIIGVKNTVVSPPVSLEQIELPIAQINQPFLDQIQDLIAPTQINSTKEERLLHSYGKSFRDIWRLRHGLIDRVVDLVIYPHNEDQIIGIIRAAVKHNVCVIPFGGGSNIVGCVENKDTQYRMCISLDMKYLNQVLAIDKQSGVARVQAGVMGPSLEQQLNQHGYTLGHFPDSFEFSTLGGWVATRSAGMQSDCFGKIEDMVLSLRMVTPIGTIMTRAVPKSSNGIDVNQLCIGSEGIFGVITEVTLKVHPVPACKDYFGYLFPNFDQGIAAIYECVQRDCLPVVTRLNDPDKTALSFAYKNRSSFTKSMIGKAIAVYLRRVKKFEMNNLCLMIIGLSGDVAAFKRQKRLVNSIFSKHGAVNLGNSPGRSFEHGKYDFPYFRDFVMDRNIMADVSETATLWSNLPQLYRETKASITQAIQDTGVASWVGCHISHNYHAGASLYFTFACPQTIGNELEQYLYIKKAAEDAFLRSGGTLSHHHAVGYEHLPWVVDDISAAGVIAVQALKNGLDPANIMNPGKIIPSAQPLTDWGYTECFVAKFASSPVLLQD